MYIGESRHDIFVELHSGYFQKGSKKADKNIEIQVSVVDENGKPVEVCMHVASTQLFWQHTSSGVMLMLIHVCVSVCVRVALS